MKPQSFENHARIVPLYHGFVFGVLFLYFIWSIVRAFRGLSFENAIDVLLAAALILLCYYARSFALTLQDRIIRLEMRLRLKELLPADLQPRIPEFTVSQLVALRFASDEELPSLAAQVLREKLEDKRAIKRMVRSWQADYLRV